MSKFKGNNLGHQTLVRRNKGLFTKLSWIVILLFVCIAAPLRALDQPAAPLDLTYHLRLSRPSSHLVEIEIEAGQVTSPTIEFVMPAWSPGRYAIYNFAKNVQQFQALSASGQLLDWTQPDKQTWQVDAHNSGGTVRARYRVFANDLNGSFSQLDSSHANLNGASTFMYVEGHQADPLTLSVDELPVMVPAWKIISGFSSATEQKSLRVASYDRLIDTPLEICGECSIYEFREGDKTIRVAVHNYPGAAGNESGQAAKSAALLTKFTDQLKKLVHSEIAMMPRPDFDVYTFIFHFSPEISEGDGMEHLNSTQIITRGSLAEDSLRFAVETAAHEFFHLWNVKRLRPAALGPFDYTRENYTRSLWFAEGVTTYYGYVHLFRSGLWSRRDFLNHLSMEVRELEVAPGRALMSAESSSFHAWFYDRAPQMQQTNFSNSTISYYNKGALLGLLLDLEIRSRTHGQKSLDDLLRSLYHNFYEAPAATHYGPGRGYEEKDLLEAASAVTGTDFGSFFESYVRGTEPLPYARTLPLAGMQLRIGADPDPSLGVTTQQEDRGVRITSVRPGSAAERAGLSRDDLIIGVDELPVITTPLSERLKMYRPGAEVPFTIERHLKTQRINVTLDPPAKDEFVIEESAGINSEQKSIRDGWLRNPK